MDDQLNTTLTELWDSLTDEQKAKAQACTSIDELVALAGEEKIELPDELLEAVGGYVFLNEDTMDFEVINDTDGSVMAYIKSADYGNDYNAAEAAAQAKAKELGQTPEGVLWVQIRRLRGLGGVSGC